MTSRDTAVAATGTPVTGTPADVRASAAPAVPALRHSALLAFDLEVVAVRQLSASLRRVTLASADLEHFGVGADPWDLRIKLVIPGPANTADHFAQVRPGADVSLEHLTDWYRKWLQIDPSDRGWMRTYTVRAQRAAGDPRSITSLPEIDLDMVLHLMDEDVFGQGVAARWVQNAQVGDHVTVLGPNRHLVDTGYGGIEFRPADSRDVLLVGDETALPAIASILDSAPAHLRGRAVIEVPCADDCLDLSTESRIAVTYLVRKGAAEGEASPHGELLEAEVRRLLAEDSGLRAVLPRVDGQDLADVNVDAELLWETHNLTAADTDGGADGQAAEATDAVATGAGLPADPHRLYAWLAGEAAVIKRLRRHLVREVGMDRNQVEFMGYWREGKPEL
ncbi:siderophore-interacting protein [Brachybacterium sp. EF45031]|uniref:siderophore-interacting protein n=1 Tax=Brachybacterium sillae TaxID=2810536 RepID=UPI00217F009C|nr:siderophore-interacting protein [Brachybacterium sillae]MCS6712115.1 siderophore-interacting protein [Brachybacterium sillae]